MTRKDYIAVANIIKWNKTNQPSADFVANPVETVLARVANEMANLMAQDNPNFDYKKFIASCGF